MPHADTISRPASAMRRKLGLALLATAACMTADARAQDDTEEAYAGLLETLAARVQQLEDREAIRALILEYGTAHDARDYRRFASLFATDGEWVGGLGTARGPEAIFELMDSTIGHDPQPEGSGTFHVMSNEQIEITGDLAAATTKWIYLVPGSDGAPEMVFLGHYDDRFVRENGTWKFLRREAPVDLPIQPADD